MKTAAYSLQSLLVVVFLLLRVAEGGSEPSQHSPVTATVKTGYHLYNPSGYRGKVGEYDVLDTGVETQLSLESLSAGSWFRLRSEVLDKDDQSYDLRLDLQQVLRSKTEYSRFRHFLDHDPLTNQDSRRDFDPTRDNILTVSELKNSTALAVPGIPFLTLTGEARSYSTYGTRQALTVAKCSQCHVVSRNRRVDTSISDITPGVRVQIGSATVAYSALLRDFTEHGEAPRTNYGDGSTSFLVRGRAPYSRIPDSSLRLHTFAVHSELPGAASLALKAQHGSRQNKLTRQEAGITTLAARVSKYVTRFLSCNVFYTRHRTDHKDGGIDHDRQRGGIDLITRPLQRSTLVCTYAWQRVERDHAEPEVTRQESYRINYTHRLHPALNLHATYERTKTHAPLLIKDHAFPGLVQTLLPEHGDEAVVRLGWSPRYNFSLHSLLRLSSTKNSRVHGDEDRREVSAGFWYAPYERLSLSGSYSVTTDDAHSRAALKTYHLRGAESLVRYNDIPYESRNHTLQFAAALRATPRLTLTVEATLVDSVADFDAILDSRDIGRFSDLSLSQRETALGMTYTFTRRLSFHAAYRYREYNDHDRDYFDGQVSWVSCGMTWSY